MADAVLTAIVCTYNRQELLRECLDALLALPLQELGIELVVVDNNSSDGTSAFAERHLDGRPFARVVRETKQGLSHARNCGFRAARTAWVAYVDDDARVAPEWGARALEVIRREMFDAYGGVFLPWYKYGRPHWFRDEYASNAGIERLQTLAENQFFSGGNCVFRRSLLETIGGFPTELGMKGSVRAYGEETQVQLRMRRMSCTLGFDPDLVVYHLVSRAKMHVSTLLRDRFAAGRDSWRAFELAPTPVRKLATAAAAVTSTSLQLSRALLRLRRPGYYVQNVVVDVAGPAAYALGQLVDR